MFHIPGTDSEATSEGKLFVDEVWLAWRPPSFANGITPFHICISLSSMAQGLAVCHLLDRSLRTSELHAEWKGGLLGASPKVKSVSTAVRSLTWA